MSATAFEVLAREAVSCRSCFGDGRLQAPLIDIAQPRWIGKKYWTSCPKIVIAALNPGAGSARHQVANQEFVKRLRAFKSGRSNLQPVMDHIRADMPTWGKSFGAYTGFYFTGLDLDIDSVATANIAWCATTGDKYPTWMLQSCLSRHTEPLLKLLEPDLVLLSGSGTWRFKAPIERLLPTARVEPMMHYANRESRERNEHEFSRVRALIAELKRRRGYQRGADE